MPSRLAEKAVEYLIYSGEITQEDKSLYIYGFFMLFSHLLYFILTAILGVLFGIFVESVLFYIMFSVLRGYAGGIHASKESICILSTTAMLIISLTTIKLFLACSVKFFPEVFLWVGVVSISLLGPLDTKEKPLTVEEKKEYRIKTIIVLIMIIAIAEISNKLGFQGIYSVCSMSVFVESILMIIGGHNNST